MVLLDADLRRRDAVLFRARADDRHLFGIYSSVLVASPIVMWLGLRREDLARPEKKAQPEARRLIRRGAHHRLHRHRPAPRRAPPVAGRELRAWIYLILFLDHLLRDGARRDAVSAGRFAALRRGRGGRGRRHGRARAVRRARARFVSRATTRTTGSDASPDRAYSAAKARALQSRAPRAHAAVLCEARRQDGPHRALRADRAHVRAFRGGDGTHDVCALRGVCLRRRDSVDRLARICRLLLRESAVHAQQPLARDHRASSLLSIMPGVIEFARGRRRASATRI